MHRDNSAQKKTLTDNKFKRNSKNQLTMDGRHNVLAASMKPLGGRPHTQMLSGYKRKPVATSKLHAPTMGPPQEALSIKLSQGAYTDTLGGILQETP